MKRVVIVQARMDSTRLPGKALADVCGRPMLTRQLDRLRRCACVDEIVVATTRREVDDPLIALADEVGARWHRGSTDDVLGRYIAAAREARADLVVRVTGDCPLIAPEVTDRVIAEACVHYFECDYASNVIQRTFPRGLDVEAMFADTLARLDRLSLDASSREHVTIAARDERRRFFLLRDVADAENNADLRWTVDTPDDLRLVREIYADLDLAARDIPYAELVRMVRARADWRLMNSTSTTWSPT